MRTMNCRILAVVIVAVSIGAALPPVIIAQPVTQHSPLSPGRSIPPSLPDLVITLFDLRNPPRVNGDHVEITAAIGVKNQGNARALPFEVAVEYTYTNSPARRSPRGREPQSIEPPGPSFASFRTAAGLSAWGPLEPGQAWYRDGEVIFPSTARGVTVLVRVVADPCRVIGIVINGVHHCRIVESNESNNASPQIVVSLP
jgi:hypothetical protein